MEKIIIIVIFLSFSCIFSTHSLSQSIHTGNIQPIKTQRIPPTDSIVFLLDTGNTKHAIPGNGVFHIYTCKFQSEDIHRITFDNPRNYEHVAVDRSKRYIAAVEKIAGLDKGDSRSLLWIIDTHKSTQWQILPDWYNVGIGGVDWSIDGFLYFAGQPKYIPDQPNRGKLIGRERNIYKILPNGTALATLTTQTLPAEHDVALSADSRWITYVCDYLEENRTEIWISKSDGESKQLVYRAGKTGVSSAHDPEFSPDNQRIAFSVFNPDFKVHYSALCVSLDIYSIDTRGSDLKILNMQNTISLIPDWKDGVILYTRLCDGESEGAYYLLENKINQNPILFIKQGISARFID